MNERDLTPDINGVAWQPSSTETFQVVPAQKIGNLYYTYLDQFRGQLLDYYIEAVDSKGNVTKSPIQQAYVGAGRFKMEGGKQVEDLDGDIEGTHPFFTDQAIRRSVTVYVQAGQSDLKTPSIEIKEDGAADWSTTPGHRIDGSTHRYFRITGRYSDEVSGLRLRYQEPDGGYLPSREGQLFTEGTYILMGDGSVRPGRPTDVVVSATIYYYSQDWTTVCLHYRVDRGAWTSVPGVPMQAADPAWFSYSLDMGSGEKVEFVTNDCATKWDNNTGRNYEVTPGEWNIKAGSVTAGPPRLGLNQPPTAVITPHNDLETQLVLLLRARMVQKIESCHQGCSVCKSLSYTHDGNQ